MSKKMAARITRYYDDAMYHQRLYEYFGGSDYFNYGYWDKDTLDQKSACENLLEKLLSFLPEKSGTILDVACGKGETVHYLSTYFELQKITGINLSGKQLATCRQKNPGGKFHQMDAATLEFEDNSYDNIMCLEAVFHFHTREKFLKEAYRVLKPQGYLLLTDILLTDWGKNHPLWWVDPENAGLNDLGEYRDLYQQVGFQQVEVMDATKECWEGYYTNLARYCCEKLEQRELEVDVLNKIAVNIFRKIPATRNYLIVAARKS